MQGYIAAFRRILVQVTDASAAEASDRFIRGLKPHLAKEVRIADPKTWEEAALVAERVASAGGAGKDSRSVDGAGQGGGGKANAHRGHVPMDLGTMSGTSSEQPAGQGQRVCFYCKKPGHFKKDCPLRKSRSKNPQRGQ